MSSTPSYDAGWHANRTNVLLLYYAYLYAPMFINKIKESTLRKPVTFKAATETEIISSETATRF